MNDVAGPRAQKLESSYAGLEKSLREQLRQQPGLLLTQVMLIDLYFKAGRRNAFMAEAKKLLPLITNPDTSFEWQRVASMGRQLHPDSELFSQGSAALLEAAEVAAAAALKMRRFGGREEDAPFFKELERAYEATQGDGRFLAGLDVELLHIAGRPSSLLHLRNLSRHVGGAQIYLKREDLSPPDTHMVMMVTGQALLAAQLHKGTLVTSTVNGSRGLIVAAAAARCGLKCTVFMDIGDSKRHMHEVFRISLMGADLLTVDVTALRQNDVREAVLEHWTAHADSCFMVTGLDAVPAPYPAMRREFAAAIGRECKRQVQAAAKRMPDVLVARGRTTADALALLPPFLGDTGTRLVCVDPQTAWAARASPNDDPVELAPFTEDEKRLAPDILEGVNYPGVEREHAWLRTTGRVEYVDFQESAALQALADLAKLEGLIPSLSTAHALAWACEEAKTRPAAQVIVVMNAESQEKDGAVIERAFAVRRDT